MPTNLEGLPFTLLVQITMERFARRWEYVFCYAQQRMPDLNIQEFAIALRHLEQLGKITITDYALDPTRQYVEISRSWSNRVESEMGDGTPREWAHYEASVIACLALEELEQAT